MGKVNSNPTLKIFQGCMLESFGGRKKKWVEGSNLPTDSAGVLECCLLVPPLPTLRCVVDALILDLSVYELGILLSVHMVFPSHSALCIYHTSLN